MGEGFAFSVLLVGVFVVAFIIGNVGGEISVMTDAFKRGYAVECKGRTGYHWECEGETK